MKADKVTKGEILAKISEWAKADESRKNTRGRRSRMYTDKAVAQCFAGSVARHGRKPEKILADLTARGYSIGLGTIQKYLRKLFGPGRPGRGKKS